MLQLSATATGVLLAAIGWLLRRRLQGGALDEIIERGRNLVALH